MPARPRDVRGIRPAERLRWPDPWWRQSWAVRAGDILVCTLMAASGFEVAHRRVAPIGSSGGHGPNTARLATARRRAVARVAAMPVEWAPADRTHSHAATSTRVAAVRR